MKTYIIEWEGPYNDYEIPNESSGLYIITGFQKYKKTELIQYCGITQQSFISRLNNKHHKKDYVTRDRKYWFGNVLTDRRITRDDLEIIESLIVYFWQFDLNIKKTKSLPSPTVVINRWYDKKGNLRKRITHIAQTLYDVIYWDGEYWHLSDSLKVFVE